MLGEKISYLQVENLEKQDSNASWSNQGYLFDWAAGKNNMNEEWFGITALGPPNADGVYEARPRMAYDVLSEVFALDPYTAGKARINAMFANMDVGLYELRGTVRQLKADNTESKRLLRLTGGDVRAEFALRGTEEAIRIDGEDAVEFSDGQMLFLDFGFQPTEDFEGQFSLNILGNVAQKRPLEFTYGDRGLDVTIETEQLVGEEFVERFGAVRPRRIPDQET